MGGVVGLLVAVVVCFGVTLPFLGGLLPASGASAGGGGKGMRIARSRKEAAEGFSRARSEAKSSFGDDRVFVERFIERPRHVEAQILADATGRGPIDLLLGLLQDLRVGRVDVHHFDLPRGDRLVGEAMIEARRRRVRQAIRRLQPRPAVGAADEFLRQPELQLRMAREIAQRHGGRLQVSQGPDCRVTLELPEHGDFRA